jgi:Tfp pilus assembly PilM family ATPase
VLALELCTTGINAVCLRRMRNVISVEQVQRIPIEGNRTQALDLLQFALARLDKSLLQKTRNIVLGIEAHECRVVLRDLPVAEPSDLRRVIRRAPAHSFDVDVNQSNFDCRAFGSGQAQDSKKQKTVIAALPLEKSLALQRAAAARGCKLVAVTVSQISKLETTIDALQPIADCFATLDVGARESTLSIVNAGEVGFIRAAFPAGTGELTNALQNTDPDPIKRRLIISREVHAIATEVRSSLDYFESQHGNEPATIYVTGSISRDDDALRTLAQSLNIVVKPFNFAVDVAINCNGDFRLSHEDLVDLSAIICEGQRFLRSADGLNLLAEEKDRTSQRNSTPWFATAVMSLGVMASVVGWGAFQNASLDDLHRDLRATRLATSRLTNEANVSLQIAKNVRETKDTVDKLSFQSKARFFYAPVLGAMQSVSLDGTELIKLKIEEDMLRTPVMRSYTNRNQKLIPAAPSRTVLRNTLVLEAKQSGSASVEAILSSIKEQSWFKENLRPIHPVLLKELITQQTNTFRETLLRIEAYAEREI